MQRQEASAEFIVKDGERVALFDEQGVLYVLKRADKKDREELFSQKEA